MTIFRRDSAGEMKLEYSGSGPAWSRELEIWLMPWQDGYGPLLRLSFDEAGTQIVPTEREAEAQRAEEERQRAECAEARERKLRRQLREAGVAPDDEPT